MYNHLIICARMYLTTKQHYYCTTHDEFLMVPHQLLICREVNFVVQLKVAPWWSTYYRVFHAVAWLRAPRYRVAGTEYP